MKIGETSQPLPSLCQAHLEMSYSYESRNVRFSKLRRKKHRGQGTTLNKAFESAVVLGYGRAAEDRISGSLLSWSLKKGPESKLRKLSNFNCRESIIGVT